MKKLLPTVLGLFLAFSMPAASQDAPAAPIENVAAVVTYTGCIIRVKTNPALGDDRPVSGFLFVPTDAAGNPVDPAGARFVLPPQKSATQDDIIKQILIECAEQQVIGTFCGTEVTHSNSFGSETYLVLRRLELTMPEQKVILIWD